MNDGEVLAITGAPLATSLHCFHGSGQVYASYPPSWDEKCCWCGDVQRVRIAFQPEAGHGPMAGPITTQVIVRPKANELCPKRE